MTTSDRTPITVNRDDYCDMSTDPVPFYPVQIIYREFSPNMADYNDSKYRETFVPRRYVASRFPEVIRRIATHGYHSRNYDPPERHDPPRRLRLDIAVYKRSIIILQMAPSTPHIFIPPGVLVKKVDGVCRTDRYGQLRYVDSRGNASSSYVENCKLIYFYADFFEGTDERPHKQAVEWCIDPMPPRFIRIDPDIRHPGIGGQNFEDDGP